MYEFAGYQKDISTISLQWIIKQFVVTNCSKERPGSIVNETLKNGISMLKDISKESDFYADFKYISIVFVIKSYEPEKICLILESRGKYPLKVKGP